MYLISIKALLSQLKGNTKVNNTFFNIVGFEVY